MIFSEFYYTKEVLSGLDMRTTSLIYGEMRLRYVTKIISIWMKIAFMTISSKRLTELAGFYYAYGYVGAFDLSLMSR